MLPSLSGIIHPPYLYKWLLLLFLFSALSAFIFLCYALYLTFAKPTEAPHISHGLGTMSAILSFIFISIYLTTNIYSSTYSLPSIEKIVYEPLNPKPNSTIRLTSIVKDKDQDKLKYKWIVKDVEISTDSYAYYYMPADSKCVEVTLEVEDSSGERVTKILKIQMPK